MKIGTETFMITPDELAAAAAGSQQSSDPHWNTACTIKNYRYSTERGKWHFELPNHYFNEFINSLKHTAVLPETDIQPLVTSEGKLEKPQKLASEILRVLEII